MAWDDDDNDGVYRAMTDPAGTMILIALRSAGEDVEFDFFTAIGDLATDELKLVTFLLADIARLSTLESLPCSVQDTHYTFH